VITFALLRTADEMNEENEISSDKLEVNNHVFATKNQRLINYLIDILSLSLGYSVLFSIFQFLYEAQTGATLSEEMRLETPVLVTEILIQSVLTIAYYTLCEFFLMGKTIGKRFTNTMVVNHNYQSISMETAFVRSLIRIIPFEPLSLLGKSFEGWHDKWSRTYVIQDPLIVQGTSMPNDQEEHSS